MTAETPWFPVSQVESEFAALLAMFNRRKPERILEIGVAYGGTLYNWITHAPSGALVACVDLFEHEGITPASLAEWRSDIDFHAIEGDSTDPAVIERARELAPFDWVFIDGSHALADVTSDWENYGTLARFGGMVEWGITAFHDIAEATYPGRWSEAPVLWEQIKLHSLFSTQEFIEDPAQGWAGIGVVWVEPPGATSV